MVKGWSAAKKPLKKLKTKAPSFKKQMNKSGYVKKKGIWIR
jgi:hypothetical protein